jgi:hypothetical protein
MCIAVVPVMNLGSENGFYFNVCNNMWVPAM